MSNNFDDFAQICNKNLEILINKSSNEISSWFNSEFKRFEVGNPDYEIYIKSLQSVNELFVNNIKAYHNWLSENFIVSPKN